MWLTRHDFDDPVQDNRYDGSATRDVGGPLLDPSATMVPGVAVLRKNGASRSGSIRHYTNCCSLSQDLGPFEATAPRSRLVDGRDRISIEDDLAFLVGSGKCP